MLYNVRPTAEFRLIVSQIKDVNTDVSASSNDSISNELSASRKTALQLSKL